MFCRKCKHTADGLGSAHEPTQRYRPGRFGSEIQLTKTKVLERSERITPSKISTNRFSSEAGYHITVQIPQYHAQDLIKAVLKKYPLNMVITIRLPLCGHQDVNNLDRWAQDTIVRQITLSRSPVSRFAFFSNNRTPC